MAPVTTTGMPAASQWLARLFPWHAQVTPAGLRADALAGLLGAALVLPQAVAFAALAGLPPAMGLAAAALPCAVAALAGSSRQAVSGPTNATSLALGAMLVPLAAGNPALVVPLALLLTLGVGLLQCALALARLGTLANFISPSVMLGFTTGAAALIAWYALAGVLGASGRVAPPEAWRQGVSPASVAVAGLTLAAAVAGRRWWRRGPFLLVALALGGGLGWWLSRQPLLPGPAPLRVGTPPSALPQWQWSELPSLWATATAQGSALLQAALALAIVALGQAMAVARLIAGRTGDALDVNRECLGQGLGNIGAALGGGMVVCGSLNRSLPNLEAGARTPLAGLASALWLVLLVALAAPLLAWIPLAGVSALLLVVAWSLFDPVAWRRVWRLDRSEWAIAATTALATVAARLELAVLAGVLLSLVVWLYRSARPALRTMGFDRQGPARPFVVIDPPPAEATAVPAADQPRAQPLPECPQLKLLRMEGSLWFGAVAHVGEHLRRLRDAAAASPEGQRHLLVMCKSMNTLDLAGAELWDQELTRRRALGGDLYMHRPRPQVLALWRDNGFLARLGEDHVFPDKRRAITSIVQRLDPAVCARCRVRVFEDCTQRPGAPVDAGL